MHTVFSRISALPRINAPLLFKLPIRLVLYTPLVVYVLAFDGKNQETPSASCCKHSFRQKVSLCINFKIIFLFDTDFLIEGIWYM